MTGASRTTICIYDEAACPEGATGASEEIEQASSRTPSRWSSFGATLTRGMNVDVHSAAEAGGDGKVADIHGASEKFIDPKTEESFKYLQVFTAICDSFSHGANDVANSIGPFAAIWAIYQNQGIEKKSEVPVWILAMGGLGIVLGLATYGYTRSSWLRSASRCAASQPLGAMRSSWEPPLSSS